MSLVYKRPGSPFWYVSRTRQSTKTVNRKQAEEFARMVLSKVWRQTQLGEYLTTWKELSDDWLDVKGDKASIEVDRQVIAGVTKLLMTDEKPVIEITSDLVSDYAQLVKARSSAATANRHLNTLAAMLKRAHRRKQIPDMPEIERYEITKKEVRCLTVAEFEAIKAHLPAWVADMADLSVQTGMRFSNVSGLKWTWLNEDRTVCIVPATVTKTGRTYTVPLSSVARAVIERQEGKHAVYVFVRPDGVTPPPSIRFWWKRACRISHISARWHDLRHAWASWMIQNGAPDRVVMLSGGWSGPRMLENYAHLSTKHLTEYAEYVNGKPVAQNAHTEALSTIESKLSD